MADDFPPSESGPDFGENPFANLPMFSDLAKAMAGQGPLNWDAARQFAGLASNSGGSEPNVDPAVRIALADLARIIEMHVRDLTGIDTQFPEITPRSDQSREMLSLLNHRHFLVKKRTSIANTLQAFARSKGLDKFRLQTLKRQKELVDSISTDMEHFIVASRLSLYNELSREIAAFDVKLAEEAEKDVRTKLLMTHPGVGVITALALTHTLGDVRRFRRKEEVVAFVGLDPLEKSSGEKRRIGSISKHGSRLMRHLLGQAAQACRDPRVKAHYLQVSRRRGRPKAKVAAARKLLINCYVMLRDDISYEQFALGGAKLACARGQER